MNLPPPLVKAVKNNSLVIFVGAGLSFNLINKRKQKIGGWKKLVEEILNFLQNEGYEVEYLIPILDNHDPITTLSLIEEKGFPKKEIAKFCKGYFDLDDSNNLSLHMKLCELSNHIISTNYDSAFEKANHKISLNTAYYGKTHELSQLSNPEEHVLFKLHGCHKDIKSMVLFKSDYDQLYEDRNDKSRLTRSYLNSIILNKTILFIGAGLGDYQINNIFRTIKQLKEDYNQPHFIINKRFHKDLKDFVEPIEIDSYDEIEGIIDALLKEKKKISLKDQQLKEDLENAISERAELEKKLLHVTTEAEKNKLLVEKASTIFFSKGVEFQLNTNYDLAIQEYKYSIELNPQFCEAFINWGNALSDMAFNKKDDKLYNEAFEKYEIAARINTEYAIIFNNWGTAILDLARQKRDEKLFQESFEKFEKATQIDPKYAGAYYNWGNSLSQLAILKSNEKLLHASFIKYKMAIENDPFFTSAYFNWGNAILDLARQKRDEKLFQESFEKFEIAIAIDPEFNNAYYNWGNAILDLARQKGDVKLFQESIEKFEMATKIDPKHINAYNNWGNTLSQIALLKNEERLFLESIEKFEIATKIDPKNTNTLYNWGNSLSHLALLNRDEKLFQESIEKFEIATKIDPDHINAYYNWGVSLSHLALLKNEEMFRQESIGKFEKAFELGGPCYELSRIYSLTKNKSKAYLFLQISLEREEVDAEFVKNDPDWKDFLNDKDFLEILEKYDTSKK